MPDSEDESIKVVLDANFFFVASQFNVDVFEELANLLNRHFEPVLLSSTQKELQGLAESSSPKQQKQAQLAARIPHQALEGRVQVADLEVRGPAPQSGVDGLDGRLH